MGGTVWGVLVAAGDGTRYGGPKQDDLLAGRRVLERALDTMCGALDAVVVAVRPGADGPAPPAADAVVEGGSTRAASVRAALAAVPTDVDIVVVHDAARPLASGALFRSVVEAVRAGADGAVPGVAVSDTVKRVDGAVVVETVDRASLVAVQTPQAFRAAVLRRAHAGGAEATDDAALVERIGGRVVVVPGEAANLKLTRRGDLAVAEAMLAEEHGS